MEINGQRAKPSRLVRIDDRLRITRNELLFEIDVIGLIERRVSAAIAAEQYRETEEGRRAREATLAELKTRRNEGEARSRRPDKRQRRQIRSLRER